MFKLEFQHFPSLAFCNGKLLASGFFHVADVCDACEAAARVALVKRVKDKKKCCKDRKKLKRAAASCHQTLPSIENKHWNGKHQHAANCACTASQMILDALHHQITHELVQIVETRCSARSDGVLDPPLCGYIFISYSMSTLFVFGNHVCTVYIFLCTVCVCLSD